MSKVYGYSDDIVCVEFIDGGCAEIDCYDKDVRLEFEDGTVAWVGYPKNGLAVWGIEIEEEGCAYYDLQECADENATPYSDVLVIDAELESYSVIGRNDPGVF